jgi:hypothetical protein
MISDLTLANFYSEDRCSAFNLVHGYIPDEASPWEEWALVPLDFGDRLWAVWSLIAQRKPERCAAVLTALREIALLCADAALPIWEVKHPDDNRPRWAIEVARAYLANPGADSADRASARALLDRALALIHRSTATFACDAAASVHYDTPYHARHAVNAAIRLGADLTLARARLDRLISELESP